MGCCQAVRIPIEASPEEKALISRQAFLGYGNDDVQKIIPEVIKLGQDGTFSPNEFNTFAHEFELNTNELDDVDSPFSKFYRYFQNKKGAYEAKHLGVLAIFLGRGKPEDKAKGFFQLLSINSTDPLNPLKSPESVHQLLESMFDVACLWLPRLSDQDSFGVIGEPGFLPNVKVETFIKQFEGIREQVVQEAQEVIFKGRQKITEADFIRVLSTGVLQPIGTPYGFRTYALSVTIKK